MPDKHAVPENQAKVLSVYLRPWVMDPDIATEQVPHIRDLNLVPATPSDDCPGDVGESRRRLRYKQPCPSYDHIAQARVRSYQHAWRTYLRGNVVSLHAKRIIVQFLVACYSKTNGDE